MFTPEMTNEQEGTFFLMANHAVENPKALQLSVDYNLARIKHGSKQLPAHIRKCILVYDLRGQRVTAETISFLRSSFAHLHELRIWK